MELNKLESIIKLIRSAEDKNIGKALSLLEKEYRDQSYNELNKGTSKKRLKAVKELLSHNKKRSALLGCSYFDYEFNAEMQNIQVITDLYSMYFLTKDKQINNLPTPENYPKCSSFLNDYYETNNEIELNADNLNELMALAKSKGYGYILLKTKDDRYIEFDIKNLSIFLSIMEIKGNFELTYKDDGWNGMKNTLILRPSYYKTDKALGAIVPVRSSDEEIFRYFKDIDEEEYNRFKEKNKVLGRPIYCDEDEE